MTTGADRGPALGEMAGADATSGRDARLDTSPPADTVPVPPSPERAGPGRVDRYVVLSSGHRVLLASFVPEDR